MLDKPHISRTDNANALTRRTFDASGFSTSRLPRDGRRGFWQAFGLGVALIAACVLLALTGCAVQAPPTGGLCPSFYCVDGDGARHG